MPDCRDVNIREYVDLRIANIEKATEFARQGMEKRLDSMNEFREALSDQRKEQVTRGDLAALEAKFELGSEGFREFRAAHEAKASQSSVLFVGVLSVLSLIVGVVSLALKIVGK